MVSDDTTHVSVEGEATAREVERELIAMMKWVSPGLAMLAKVALFCDGYPIL